MTILEYNIRTILVHIIIIIGAFWVFHEFYNALKCDTSKKWCFVIGIITVLIISCSMFLFLAYNDVITTKGEIVDITCTGSWAGLLDSYTIYISQENGEVIHYNTSIFSSYSFKKSISELSIGDEIEIYANSLLNIMYKFT